jgi:hypothetical protein
MKIQTISEFKRADIQQAKAADDSLLQLVRAIVGYQ